MMITAEEVARAVNTLYNKSYVGERIIDIAIAMLSLIVTELDTRTLVQMYNNTSSKRLRKIIVRELKRRYSR
jgi:hypothetical protein